MNARLHTSLFLRTIRGELSPRPPIWLMRQAGRYMPEYRAVREKHSMLQVIQTPELACQVTMQPIDAFAPDAAIIFADILTLLIGMGIELDFVQGEGPKIFNPLRSAAEIVKLRTPAAKEHLGYTLEAVRLVSQILTPRGIPLIGFSGAPFTLAAYAVEDHISDNLLRVKRLMVDDRASWEVLQTKLSTVVADYLVEQAHAGASVLQLFDSWVGALSPQQFREFVFPHLQSIVEAVRARTDAPIIYFGTNTAGLFPIIAELGVDVVGVDWRISLNDAQRLLGKPSALQGNLDPSLLTGSWTLVRASVDRVITEGRQLHGHLFNVGHGLVPSTSVDTVRKLVRYVQHGSDE